MVTTSTRRINDTGMVFRSATPVLPAGIHLLPSTSTSVRSSPSSHRFTVVVPLLSLLLVLRTPGVAYGIWTSASSTLTVTCRRSSSASVVLERAVGAIIRNRDARSRDDDIATVADRRILRKRGRSHHSRADARRIVRDEAARTIAISPPNVRIAPYCSSVALVVKSVYASVQRKEADMPAWQP